MMWEFVFHSDAGSTFNNAALLIFRVLLCFQMLRVHGLKKIGIGVAEAEIVPNPLRLPPVLNRSVAYFSGLVAPVFIAFGFLTRLSALPILAVTLTGYFVVHRRDPESARDIPFMYSLSYIYVLLAGPGSFSVDHILWRNF